MWYMSYTYLKNTYYEIMRKTVRFEIGGQNKVKTTIAIPSYLKALAIEKELNLSLILENALKTALNPKKSGKISNPPRTLVENTSESENKPILDLFNLINTYSDCARSDSQNNFFSTLKENMNDIERYRKELLEIKHRREMWRLEGKNPKDLVLPERLQIIDNFFDLKDSMHNSKCKGTNPKFKQIEEMIDYWIASGHSVKDLKLPPPYDEYLKYFEVEEQQSVIVEKQQPTYITFKDFYLENEKAFWNCTKKKVEDETTKSSYKSALLKHEIGLIQTPDDIGNFSERYGKNMSKVQKNCVGRILNTFVKLRVKEFNGFTPEEFRFELKNIELGNRKREIIYDYTNDEIVYAVENLENVQAKKIFALMVFSGCRYQPIMRFLKLSKAEKEKRMTVKENYIHFQCDGLGYDSKDFIGLFFPIEAQHFILSFKKLEKPNGDEYTDGYFSDKFMTVELPKTPEKPKQDRTISVSGVRKWFYNFGTYQCKVDKIIVDWISSRSERDYSVGDTFYASKMTESHKAYSDIILPELKKVINPRLFKR